MDEINKLPLASLNTRIYLIICCFNSFRVLSMSDISYKVLVVVPDVALLELLGEVTSFCNYIPLLAKNEFEAVKLCEEENDIAAVVVDWRLTKIHFPALLKNLSTISPSMGRFVLIDDHDNEINEFIERGEFCCYMKKPFVLKKFQKGLAGCVSEYECANKVSKG